MDYLALSERFVAERFPAAAIVIIGGSTARGTRTATSDVDLLVIGDEIFADEGSSLAATYEFEDEVFEVFAYTHDGFNKWACGGIAQHRPVIVHMLLEGAPVRGGESLTELRSRWRESIDAGPDVPRQELDLRRYAITDLVDDLRDARDSLEQHLIAFTLFEKMAEFMLLSNHQWIGTGKYLPRRLRAWNAERADAMAAPLLEQIFSALADQVEHELDLAGGRLQAGFVR